MFDKIIKALYGDVDQYDAEVRFVAVTHFKTCHITQLAGNLQICMPRCKAHSMRLLSELAAR
jgi:hypothetical protein